MTTTNNPLQQYFRQPAIYMPLLSGGKYWKNNAVNIPAVNELPVLPMTAIDEVTIRTPDGLLNGQSTVSVIESCIPNITDAWEIPVVDLDAILLAIRIASYGHTMDITSKCPNCNETSDFEIDLRTALDALSIADYDKPFVFNNVTATIRPMTYREVSDNNAIQFEERKVHQINADDNMSGEEKLKLITESFKTITALSIAAVAKSVTSISIDEGTATEPTHIAEYLSKCDAKFYTALRNHITDLKKQCEVKPVHIKCPDCNNEYDMPFTLDLSNFFD